MLILRLLKCFLVWGIALSFAPRGTTELGHCCVGWAHAQVCKHHHYSPCASGGFGAGGGAPPQNLWGVTVLCIYTQWSAIPSIAAISVGFLQSQRDGVCPPPLARLPTWVKRPPKIVRGSGEEEQRGESRRQGEKARHVGWGWGLQKQRQWGGALANGKPEGIK